MPSFLSKVFRSKKNEEPTDGGEQAVAKPPSLLDGVKYEKVSPPVSPSVSNLPENSQAANTVRGKEGGFTSFLRPKSPEVKPKTTSSTRDADIPQLSLNIQSGNGSSLGAVFEDSSEQDGLMDISEIGRRRLTPAETLILARACAEIIKERGLETLGVMHPHWYSSSPKVQRKLISAYLRSLSSQSQSLSPNLASELQSTRSHQDVASVLRWALRHLALEGSGFGKDSKEEWGWYHSFSRSERDASYPEKALSQYLTTSIPQSHNDLLIVVMDLATSLAAHATSNGISGSKFAKLIGLNLIAKDAAVANMTYPGFYRRWDTAGRIMEHLFLAYIRDQASRSPMPKRLTELVAAYPYHQNNGNTDDGLLARPRFSTRTYRALFVQLQAEGAQSTPRNLTYPPLRTVQDALAVDVNADVLTANAAYALFQQLRNSVPRENVAQAASSPDLSGIFTDDSLQLLALSTALEENHTRSPTSESFTILDLQTPSSPQRRAVSHTASLSNGSAIRPTLGDLSKDPNWEAFSASGFFDEGESKKLSLAETLMDTEVEVSTPPAKPVSRSTSKKNKETSKETAASSKIPETAQKKPAETVKSSIVDTPAILDLDEAFIDFWSDALLDPIADAWPTFAIAQLRTPIRQEDGDVQYLLVERVVVPPKPKAKPPPVPEPAAPTLAKPAEAPSPVPAIKSSASKASKASTTSESEKRPRLGGMLAGSFVKRFTQFGSSSNKETKDKEGKKRRSVVVNELGEIIPRSSVDTSASKFPEDIATPKAEVPPTIAVATPKAEVPPTVAPSEPTNVPLPADDDEATPKAQPVELPAEPQQSQTINEEPKEPATQETAHEPSSTEEHSLEAALVASVAVGAAALGTAAVLEDSSADKQTDATKPPSLQEKPTVTEAQGTPKRTSRFIEHMNSDEVIPPQANKALDAPREQESVLASDEKTPAEPAAETSHEPQTAEAPVSTATDETEVTTTPEVLDEQPSAAELVAEEPHVLAAPNAPVAETTEPGERYVSENIPIAGATEVPGEREVSETPVVEPIVEGIPVASSSGVDTAGEPEAPTSSIEEAAPATLAVEPDSHKELVSEADVGQEQEVPDIPVDKIEEEPPVAQETSEPVISAGAHAPHQLQPAATATEEPHVEEVNETIPESAAPDLPPVEPTASEPTAVDNTEEVPAISTLKPTVVAASGESVAEPNVTNEVRFESVQTPHVAPSEPTASEPTEVHNADQDPAISTLEPPVVAASSEPVAKPNVTDEVPSASGQAHHAEEISVAPEDKLQHISLDEPISGSVGEPHSESGEDVGIDNAASESAPITHEDLPTAQPDSREIPQSSYVMSGYSANPIDEVEKPPGTTVSSAEAPAEEPQPDVSTDLGILTDGTDAWKDAKEAVGVPQTTSHHAEEPSAAAAPMREEHQEDTTPKTISPSHNDVRDAEGHAEKTFQPSQEHLQVLAEPPNRAPPTDENFTEGTALDSDSLTGDAHPAAAVAKRSPYTNEVIHVPEDQLPTSVQLKEAVPAPAINQEGSRVPQIESVEDGPSEDSPPSSDGVKNSALPMQTEVEHNSDLQEHGAVEKTHQSPGDGADISGHNEILAAIPSPPQASDSTADTALAEDLSDASKVQHPIDSIAGNGEPVPDTLVISTDNTTSPSAADTDLTHASATFMKSEPKPPFTTLVDAQNLPSSLHVPPTHSQPPTDPHQAADALGVDQPPEETIQGEESFASVPSAEKPVEHGEDQAVPSEKPLAPSDDLVGPRSGSDIAHIEDDHSTTQEPASDERIASEVPELVDADGSGGEDTGLSAAVAAQAPIASQSTIEEMSPAPQSELSKPVSQAQEVLPLTDTHKPLASLVPIVGATEHSPVEDSIPPAGSGQQETESIPQKLVNEGRLLEETTTSNNTAEQPEDSKDISATTPPPRISADGNEDHGTSAEPLPGQASSEPLISTEHQVETPAVPDTRVDEPPSELGKSQNDSAQEGHTHELAKEQSALGEADIPLSQSDSHHASAEKSDDNTQQPEAATAQSTSEEVNH